MRASASADSVCILNHPGYRCQRHTLQHEMLLWDSFYVPFLNNYEEKGAGQAKKTNIRVLFLLRLMRSAAYRERPSPGWTPHVGEFMGVGLKVT